MKKYVYLGELATSLFLTGIFIIPLLYFVYNISGKPDYANFAQQYVFAQAGCYNKIPAHNVYYAFVVVLVPAILASLFITKKIKEAFGCGTKICSISGIVFVWLVVCSVLYLFRNFIYIEFFISVWTLLFALLVSILIYRYREKLCNNSVLYPFFLLVAIGYFTYLGIFAYSFDYLMNDGHWNAYCYSIFQVFDGKILLVNWLAQYGLYPYFYLPVLKIFGISTVNINLIAGALFAAIFILLYLALDCCVKRKIFNVLTLIAIAYFARIMFYLPQGSLVKQPEIYLQYFPHRVIFPALLVYIVSKCLGDGAERNILTFLKYLVFALAIAWNIDSGVVCFVVWLILRFYTRLYNDKKCRARVIAVWCVKETLIAVIALLLVGALVIAWIWHCSGSLPDLDLLFLYQRLYYYYGYFALETPMLHIWIIPMVLYIAGVFVAVRRLFVKGDKTRQHYNLTLALSLIGVGIFPYYFNRSFDSNLFAVWWPAILLAGIFADCYLDSINSNYTSRLLRFHDMFLVVIIMTVLIIPALSAVLGLAEAQKNHDRPDVVLVQGQKQISSAELYANSVKFILQTTMPAEKIAIFSQSPLYYHYSGRYPLVEKSSLAEMATRREVDALLQAVNDGYFDKIYIERLFPYQKSLSYGKQLEKLIGSRYKLLGYDRKYGFMMLYIKK